MKPFGVLSLSATSSNNAEPGRAPVPRDWGESDSNYAMLGRARVLLLCGGDKRKQSSDIERALEYLKDYKERTGTDET
jgi:hypothetical protein